MILRLQVSLLQFASQCYPGRLEYVNHCIGESADMSAAKYFSKKKSYCYPTTSHHHVQFALVFAVHDPCH